ncbi:MAG: exosortase-associated EpsI family protein, partial [Planctomycetaceae bacterium]
SIVLYDLRTDRWGPSVDLTAAAERLQQVPIRLGDWHGQETEIPARHLEIAGAKGHLSRVYVNQRDGRTVRVLILCGRHGPISVHSPEVCFTGAGFVLQQTPRRAMLAPERLDRAAEFWVGDFAKASGGLQSKMRTYWSWGTDGTWNASDNPRIEFAGSDVLYKMYLTEERSATRDATADGPDTCAQFSEILLPAVNSALFEAPRSDQP